MPTKISNRFRWLYPHPPKTTRPQTPLNRNGAEKSLAAWKPTVCVAADLAPTICKPACLSRRPMRRTVLYDLHEIKLYEDVEPRPRPVQRVAPKPRVNERVEINIQPELDFSARPDDRAHPLTALVPVAGLAERRKAALLDGLFLALTYAGFLGLFRSLGGQLVLEKVDAVVYLATFFLFYAQYFFLFTTFAGATPGMQLRCLTIVRLDGSLPETRQLLWRSFGYVISGATVLGFIWSLWDEDHFTWQDRISQTYITGATPLLEPEAFEVPAGRGHRFAHK